MEEGLDNFTVHLDNFSFRVSAENEFTLPELGDLEGFQKLSDFPIACVYTVVLWGSLSVKDAG